MERRKKRTRRRRGRKPRPGYKRHSAATTPERVWKILNPRRSRRGPNQTQSQPKNNFSRSSAPTIRVSVTYQPSKSFPKGNPLILQNFSFSCQSRLEIVPLRETSFVPSSRAKEFTTPLHSSCLCVQLYGASYVTMCQQTLHYFGAILCRIKLYGGQGRLLNFKASSLLYALLNLISDVPVCDNRVENSNS